MKTGFKRPSEILEDSVKWFLAYYGTFGADTGSEEGRMLRHKFDHTMMVRRKMDLITGMMGLETEEAAEASLAALFHDAGRFDQYRRHGTYADSRSEDHAELGLKILGLEGVMDALEPGSAEMITHAIRWHNKPALPEIDKTSGGGGRRGRLARLVRDADKLAIFDFVADYYERGLPIKGNPLFFHVSDEPGVSPEILGRLRRGEFILNDMVKKIDEVKLYQAGWIYDINFPESFSDIKSSGYIARMLKTVSDPVSIQDLTDSFARYIDRMAAPAMETAR
jgi:hypothetical protein